MSGAVTPSNGIDKAAILLMSLGESAAAQVLKYLGPREVQRIGVAMAALQNITRDTVQATLEDFMAHVREHTALGVDSEEYIRKVFTDALGSDKANAMVDRILLGGKSKGLESLKWMDPRSILELVRYEHPQIIAIVLAYLDADQAGQILNLLPEALRSDVLLRIASLDDLQPLALQELNDMLEKRLQGSTGTKVSRLGGVKCAADILNFVGRGTDQVIIEAITEVDADLATRIQDLMFVFDDVTEIDDRGIQTLLREVSTETLLVALKGTDETVQQKVFKNMSQRAAEMLKEDLSAKGPVRLSEVEAAQKEILTIARRLADEGQIVLGGAGGEAMV